MDYTIHRMLQGVPEGSKEIHMGSSLPLESCIDYMHGVDFRKGCYIGQELTARTFFTGLVRKRIMPISLDPNSRHHSSPTPINVDTSMSLALPDSGADVRFVMPQKSDASTSQPGKSRSAGKFLNGIHNIGLALLRLEQVDKSNSEAGHPQLVLEALDGSPLYLHAYRPSWWDSETLQKPNGFN